MCSAAQRLIAHRRSARRMTPPSFRCRSAELALELRAGEVILAWPLASRTSASKMTDSGPCQLERTMPSASRCGLTWIASNALIICGFSSVRTSCWPTSARARRARSAAPDRATAGARSGEWRRAAVVVEMQMHRVQVVATECRLSRARHQMCANPARRCVTKRTRGRSVAAAQFARDPAPRMSAES